MDPFWKEVFALAPTTIATAVLTSIVSFAMWTGLTHLWHRWLSRRLRRLALLYAKTHGEKEVALVLSVLNNIQQSVAAHLTTLKRQDMPMLKVHRDLGFSNVESDWHGFLEEVKKQVRIIRTEGFVRVFLFTSLPVAMAAMVDTTLTNGPEVVHHWDSNHYVPVGRLIVETVRL